MDFGTNWALLVMIRVDFENTWSYGFEVQCFYSDIEEDSDTKKLRNRPDDNIRVSIIEKVNYGADRRFASPIAKQITAEEYETSSF